MTKRAKKRITRRLQRFGKPVFVGLALSSFFVLTGCAAMQERLAQIGQPPPLMPLSAPQNQPGYRTVSLPMPEAAPVLQQKNSLWQSNRTAFFKDQRAGAVGDILTVVVDIKDEAEMENETERSRTTTEDASLGALLGLETKLGKFLPDAVDPTDLIDSDSVSNMQAEGEIEREEAIKVKIAAMITQILPNGNLVIHGRQEIRVNFEVREIQVAGIIRPEDISTDNTIGSDQIAEARISYGGRGHITEMQKPRYGAEAFDIIFPF